MDVPLRAQPRHCLVVVSEREVRKDPRRTGSATAKQAVSKDAQGVSAADNLSGCRQLAALVRHGMVLTLVIRLGEHCRDDHLAVSGGDGAAPRVEGAEDGCSRQALLQRDKARLFGVVPVPGGVRSIQAAMSA